MKFEDWGLTDYQKAWRNQEEIFNAVIQAKIAQQDTSDIETLVFCEHPHVYTLGKSGSESNLLVNEEFPSIPLSAWKYYPPLKSGYPTCPKPILKKWRP